MRNFMFILLFTPQFLLAQDSTSMANQYSPGTVWSALIVGGIVLILLFTGIIVQARWKNRDGK